MLTRIITAVVALCLLVPILIFAPAWAVCCVWGLLAMIAVYEFAGCLGLKKEKWLVLGSMALTAVCVVTHGVEWKYTDWWSAHPGLYTLWGELAFISFALLIVLFMISAVARYRALPIDRLMMLLGLCVYACAGFFSLTGLTVLSESRVYLWVALCIPWVADSLAYFTGRFFGKRKLCPDISPKKTVAGAVGGVASTGIAAVLVYGFAVEWSVWKTAVVFVAAALLAIVSIFGDLFASVVKRHFGVKDYGKLFPGHGGVMDRFDSMIPVAILLYVLTNLPFVADLLTW